MVERDKYDQLVEPWTDTDYALLAILEEVAFRWKPDRTLSAYMADIYDLLNL